MRTFAWSSLLPLLLLSLLCVACNDPYQVRDDDAAGDDDGAGDDDASPGEPCSTEGQYDCLDNVHRVCSGGQWMVDEVCDGLTPGCDPSLGCISCLPGTTYCDGQDVVQCDADGGGTTVIETCLNPQICYSNTCMGPCEVAASNYSYLGCDFLAVSTSNAELGPAFDNDFAVVVGNPASSATSATISVSRGGSPVGSPVTVAPNTSTAIQLPYVAGLRNFAAGSTIVTDGAYEIHSDVPIMAYQFNPLHFEANGTYSYTNDASLLLAEHNLTGNYMASTWPTWGKGSWDDFLGVSGDWSFWYPGFVAIAATTDGTSVTLTSSTNTAGGAIPPLSPGQQSTFILNRGDVAQVFSQMPANSSDMNFCASQGWAQAGDCPPGTFGSCDNYCSVSGGDLTGTLVTATADVAVFAGHNCTFMPFSSWACDHLEEMMFPLETWGQQMIMTAPVHPSGTGVARTFYRVMSASANNLVQFAPAVHASVSLNAATFIEFETDQDFVVMAASPISITQTLLGQDENQAPMGDPAMGTGIPQNQVRSNYDFLTPDTYTANYINIVAEVGAPISLDGQPITAGTPIGTTTFTIARLAINPGSHHIETANGTPFGITTYGYASYTSYLYPGGMDFKR